MLRSDGKNAAYHPRLLMIKTPFTGGCYCGAIRYRCTAKPEQIEMFKCHCHDCQRVSGGGHTPIVFVPAETFTFTQGTPRYFATDSEAMGAQAHRRSFCPECGSRLTGGEGPGSTGIGMTVGSLDDSTGFTVSVDFWVADAQPWDLMDPASTKFEKLPG